VARYLFGGAEVGISNRDQLALLRRNYLGFVFQGYNLLARTSALDNVELPLIYQGMAGRSGGIMAREALAKVGLATAKTTIPPSFPAASSSAWRSRGRS
jgi:putative ABC transport system ATP-binding protein